MRDMFKFLNNTVLKFAIYASIILIVAMTINETSYFINKAPVISVDESLNNVTETLYRTKQAAFPFSPIQANSGALRHDVFFNYGPPYFYLAAFAKYLFGDSIILQRFMHLVIILTCVAFIAWSYRKEDTPIGLIALMPTIVLFFAKQYPMIRPDIAVVFFGSLAILFTTEALKHRLARYWFLAAFSCSFAIAAHQISWALSLSLICIWVIDSFLANNKINIKESLHNFSFSILGVATAASLYLYFINFRLAELIDFWTKYFKSNANSNKQSYIDVLSGHMLMAWQPSKILLVAIVSIYAAAVFSILFILFSKQIKNKYELLSIVLAPTIFTLFYVASLGIYPNFHTGYVIFVHIGTIWTTCSVIILFSKIFTKFISDKFTFIIKITSIVFVPVSLSVISVFGHFNNTANNNIPYDTYINQINSLLPRGTTVFTASTLGVRTKEFTTPILYSEGKYLALLFNDQERTKIVPSAQALGQFAIGAHAVLFLADKTKGPREKLEKSVELDSLWQSLNLLEQPYEEIGVVYAEPYGETRLYRKPDTSPIIKQIAAKRLAQSQWYYGPGTEVAAKSRFIEPAKFDVKFYNNRGNLYADQTLQTSLPQGLYAIDIKILGDDEKTARGIIAATTSPSYSGQTYMEGFETPVAPYSKAGQVVTMIVDHYGGDIFFSHFSSNNQTNISITSIHRLDGDKSLKDNSLEVVQLPSVNQWNVGASTITSENTGLTRKLHSAQGYNGLIISSPPINLPAGTRLIYVPDVITEEGQIMVAISDTKYRYRHNLVPANRPITFSVGQQGAFKVEFASTGQDETTKSKFTIGAGKLFVVTSPSSPDFAKRLSKCYGQNKTENSNCL